MNLDAKEIWHNINLYVHEFGGMQLEFIHIMNSNNIIEFLYCYGIPVM